MGHNSVVSGYPKSIEILRVDELSMRPLDLGRHNSDLKDDTTSLNYYQNEDIYYCLPYTKEKL